MVRDYESCHRIGANGDHLRVAAELRNVLIHQKTQPYYSLAIPTLPVVERLERIAKNLANPVKVLPRFQRRVETVDPSDLLGDVLRIIAKRDFSQFPVYSDERFRGLLTENGITRWLSRNVTAKMSLVDFDEVQVK